MPRRRQEVEREEDAAEVNSNNISIKMSKFSFREYNKLIPWEEYIEQFERMCRVKGLGGDTDDLKDARKDLLLAYVGPTPLRAIRNHMTPLSLDECPLDEIKKGFLSIYQPGMTIFAARMKFERAVREMSESLTQFADRLKELSKPCKYSATIVDERLRDRFVAGCKNTKLEIEIRQRWPEGNNDQGIPVSFKTVLGLADTVEKAQTEVQEVGTSGNDEGIYKIENNFKKGNSFRNRRDQQCWNCGYERHPAAQCPARGVMCRSCNRNGHYSKMCRSDVGGKRRNLFEGLGKKGITRKIERVESDETETEDEEIMLVGKVGKNPRAVIRVRINGQRCDMEFDSGARISTIDKQLWDKLGYPKLEKTNMKVSGYGKNMLKVLGKLSVKVTLRGITKELKVLVMDVIDVPLFGIPWIMAFGLNLPSEVRVCKINNEKEEEDDKEALREFGKLKGKYKEIFKDELGTAKGIKARIFLKKGAKPVAFAARRVPFPLRQGVQNEIERLEKIGIIQKVDPSVTPIEWATPTVNVKKPEGQIRICGDFRVTLNSNMIEDKHIMPTFEDLTSKLVDGARFTVIDLKDAYLQIEVDEDSKQFLIIATHYGYYAYNRMPFGISSAPGIFQRYMEEVLGDLPNVGILLDDIIITGPNRETHIKTAEEVMRRLKERGLRVKWNKCRFYEKEVKYLGHMIDKNGIHPMDEKIEAIKKAPAPSKVQQLKSFLGMVNYYSRFAPNLQGQCKVLHQLLRKGTQWKWTKAEDECFKRIKDIITSKDILVPYDLNKPVKVVCDASEDGLGAVLIHIMADGSERPVAFASTILNAAEQRYAPIDREALALVYGVSKFHQYIYGREFVLETDHKPLERIFGSKRDLSKVTNGRLVRWALKLSGYQYTVQYREGAENICADALSRLPLQRREDEGMWENEVSEIKAIIDENRDSLYDKGSLQKATREDEILKRVIAYIENGWPGKKLEGELGELQRRKDELDWEDGVLTWLEKIIVPNKLRRKTLTVLHRGHPGVSAMRALSRYYVWWPGMSKAVEDFVHGCEACQEHRDNIAEVPLYPWNVPSRPWERVHLDFAGPFEGHQWLVLIDAFSKWIEIAKMKKITATATINRLREWFCRFGVPSKIVTDNGPQLIGREFEQFCKDNNIKHVKTTPYHPKTNGLAERTVKTFKRRYSSSRQEGNDANLALQSFLLSYRNTPQQTTGVSPAELLLGRRVPTLMDNLRPNYKETIQERVWKQKTYHDKKTKNREFKKGEEVWVRKEDGNGWKAGVVEERSGELSYKVKVGGIVKRKHADQLRARDGAREVEGQAVAS